MVAFELHASALIESLWSTVARTTGLPRDELAYFKLHMGGDDPAEKYHVELTQELIARIVPPGDRERFLTEFRNAYRLNFDWCRALVELPCSSHDADVLVWHEGACHCGGVRFAVQAPAALDAVRCNCSICEMSGFLHLSVSPERFRLLSGEDLLTTYQYNLRIAKHTFCRLCGTKPFYRPRADPDGYSVDVRSLNRSTVTHVEVSEFDGQHWEDSIAKLTSRYGSTLIDDVASSIAPSAGRESASPVWADTLREYAAQLNATGSVMLPAGLVFTDEEVQRIDALQMRLPEERVLKGDAGDRHDSYVRRILRDDPGQYPRRVNRPLSDDIMEILDDHKRNDIFSALFDWREEFIIRRCQTNRLVEGSFIGVHLDAAANPDFEFSVILQLGHDFKGGEFITYPANGDSQVFVPTHGTVLVTTCTSRHEVAKVTENERTALVYFYSRCREPNRRDLTAECAERVVEGAE
jgi:hypothetical protein